MVTRIAACHCGQLRLEVEGDPFVVSICHCLACQRRTGSAFGMQAAFRPGQVQVVGRSTTTRGSLTRRTRRNTSSISALTAVRRSFTRSRPSPDLIVVSVGSFADPAFPPPTEAGYQSRRHPWLGQLPDDVARYAPELWWPIRPYESGEYAGPPTADANCSKPIRSSPTLPTTSRAARASPADRRCDPASPPRDRAERPGPLHGWRGLRFRADP